MLPTGSGRWILVYEGANTVSGQTFHSLQSFFMASTMPQRQAVGVLRGKEPIAIRGYTLDARSCQACQPANYRCAHLRVSHALQLNDKLGARECPNNDR
jgi:hypothetical protein